MMRAVKMLAVAGFLGAAPVALPALAQQAQPPATDADSALLGLAVYSSDGQRLGAVTQVGMAGNTRAVRAELGEFLGQGSSPVIIPVDMLVQKADRIELAMTADEVKGTLSQQRQQRQRNQ